LISQLGLTVVGGALVGYGIGYGVDSLTDGRAGRLVGILFGLASGLWAAGRMIVSVLRDDGGDDEG